MSELNDWREGDSDEMFRVRNESRNFEIAFRSLETILHDRGEIWEKENSDLRALLTRLVNASDEVLRVMVVRGLAELTGSPEVADRDRFIQAFSDLRKVVGEYQGIQCQ